MLRWKMIGLAMSRPVVVVLAKAPQPLPQNKKTCHLRESGRPENTNTLGIYPVRRGGATMIAPMKLLEKQSIPDALRRLGITHQGRAFSCPNPAHPKGDQHPSAGFFGDGDARWKCHSCGESGDAVDLVRVAKGCDFAEAKRFLGITGQSSPTTTRPTAARQAGKPGGRARTIVVRGRTFEITTTRDEAVWPEVHPGTDSELAALAALREWDIGCLRFLSRTLGVLVFGTYRGHAFWAVRDARGLALEARRVDGELWPNGKKPHCFSDAGGKAWPVGLSTNSPADSCRVILLTEGGPDYIASFHLLHRAGALGWTLPICCLGAAIRLSDDALATIRARDCVVWSQPDDKGTEGAARWGSQIQSAGSRVRVLVPHEDDDIAVWWKSNPSRDEINACLPFSQKGVHIHV